MREICGIFLGAALAAGFSTSALAQAGAPAPACGPLVQAAAIELQPIPNDARFLVPASINGTPQKLLLSTDGGLISINQAAAKALGLAIHDSDRRALDVNGFASRRYVEPDDFSIANAHVRHSFVLTPDPGAGHDPVDDGMFDAGLHYHDDVEMDFAGRTLKYFSPDHCPGQVIHWQAQDLGEIPLRITARVDARARHGDIAGDAALMNSLDGLSQADYFLSLIDSAPGIAGSDIRINVVLDGANFTASIDTALEYSTVNSAAAKARLSVSDSSQGSMPLASLVAEDPNRQGAAPAAETVNVYGTHSFAHTFHTLSLGAVTVTNPKMLVRPDRTGAYDNENDTLTGTRLYRMDDNVVPDISIGMDILSKLHLYFAFGERKLYVTPAETKTAQNQAPPQ